MPALPFEQLLKETMGLDVASVGASVVDQAVKERQQACGLRDAAAYWEHVKASDEELQQLIEAVVVPETWFFRDAAAFAALGRLVAEDWLRGNRDTTLRLLSVPCSTGEEPYSMAMALLDAGVPANRFSIDAVDISARALEHGRRGVYGRSSFRGGDLGFRDRYFTARAGGHQLVDGVRGLVQFRQDNLFSPGFLPGSDIYDVIFCRNVLIYFDRATQARAISILGRLLTPRGHLFVGASEAGVFQSSEFTSARIPMAFAFQKGTAAPRPLPAPVRAIPVTAPPRGAAVARKTPVAVVARPPDAPPGVDQARTLADQGRFVEAARCCEDHLEAHGPTAEALYLLGLVRDASGNHADAASYYRKALYLDPNHGEALMHLALLLEDQGKAREAQLLRDRMKRLAGRVKV